MMYSISLFLANIKVETLINSNSNTIRIKITIMCPNANSAIQTLLSLYAGMTEYKADLEGMRV